MLCDLTYCEYGGYRGRVLSAQGMSNEHRISQSMAFLCDLHLKILLYIEVVKVGVLKDERRLQWTRGWREFI